MPSSRLPVVLCGFCVVFPAPRREVLLLYGSATFGKVAAALYSVLYDSLLSDVAVTGRVTRVKTTKALKHGNTRNVGAMSAAIRASFASSSQPQSPEWDAAVIRPSFRHPISSKPIAGAGMPY
jgi:MFS-type transporter involved in bile tolerance (Atg22 family)